MTWIILLQDSCFSVSGDTKNCKLDVVPLKHPGTGKKSLFIFNKQHEIQEVLSFSEPKRSWFINDTVSSNGNLYLSSPIDPLLLILPYLEEFSNQASPLDQIINHSEFPSNDRLLKSCSVEQLLLIADQKGSKDLNAFKFNRQKCLLWLTKKVDQVTKVLKCKKLHVGTGAVSASFVKSEADISTCEDDYKSFAFGVISEYISYDLSKLLKIHLGIIENDSENHKRKSLTNNDSVSKKIKLEKDLANIDDYIKPIKVEKLKAPSAKEKAWGKAASGTKSISSFFTKKIS